MKFDWTKPCEKLWQAPEKFVCPDCAEDDFLKETIEKHLESRKCDYCDRSSEKNIAAPFAAIMEPIAEALCHYFTPAEEAGLLEECNPGDLMTTLDALKALPFNSCSEKLLAEVAGAFGHENWEGKKGNPHDFENSMLYSWSNFASLVKHRQRFFFSTPESGYQFPWVLPQQEMFEKIKTMVDDYDLVRRWPGEDEEGFLYRARKWEYDPASQIASLKKKNGIKWPPDSKDFGPPPENKAGAQRMSPAGISYTYLAMERATALAEVVRRPPCQLAMARFAFERDALSLLDLTRLPKVSVFDQAKRHDYLRLSFLRTFDRLISFPVDQDGREHYEYVPTQIVSEYFAQVYRTPDDKLIDGMIYRSAVRPGGRNVVLFPPKRRDRKCFTNHAKLDGEPEMVEVQNWDEFFGELNEATSKLR
ncbi:MAG: RES family NAD+ phosphorylase [Desulfobulbia bacterium]